MASPVFGDELLPNDAKALAAEQAPVGGRIVMAPEHRSVGTEPAAFSSLEPGVPEGREEPASGDEPPGDFPKERSMLLPGHVDDCVQRDHGGERTRRKVDRRKVRAQKPRAGDEAAGPTNLNVGDVDPCDLELAGHDSAHRDSRAGP